MIRIGIIGSDNSHSITFSQMINDQKHKYHVNGMKVLYLYGLDEERNKEVSEKGGIPYIVKRPEDMIGKIDCAFIEFRDGALHYKYAKPFIEAGIPVFIDKPLATSVEDAKRIVSLAIKNNVLLTSFSALRFSEVVQEVKRIRDEIVTLSVTGPGDPDSIYSGLIFYGIHVAEILEEILGPFSGRVYAVRRNKTILGVIEVDNGPLVSVLISNDIPYHFSIRVLTKEKVIYKNIEDFMECYKNGVLTIKRMLEEKKWPLKADDMIVPIKVIKAIEESYIKGTAIRF
ncbi:MAG: Gfo/Idh/MocA family oxidoreductase [Thermoprotei archaeon]|nr:Gfo/Idh/MocA family oxidoreductase [Thermoprotei archaeon]